VDYNTHFGVQKVVDGSSFNNLIKVNMNALLINGELSKDQLFGKLLCFGANGVLVFHGAKIGIIK
jgi:hypothetical protein